MEEQLTERSDMEVDEEDGEEVDEEDGEDEDEEYEEGREDEEDGEEEEEEEDGEDEEDELDEDARSKLPSKKPRKPPTRTNKVIDPPCTRCVKFQLQCVAQLRGKSACYECGRQKLRCTPISTGRTISGPARTKASGSKRVVKKGRAKEVKSSAFVADSSSDSGSTEEEKVVYVKKSDRRVTFAREVQKASAPAPRA
jgi:hypothetical protein